MVFCKKFWSLASLLAFSSLTQNWALAEELGELKPNSTHVAKRVPAHHQLKLKEVSYDDVKKIIKTNGKLNLNDAVPAALKKNLGIAIARVQKSIVEENPEIQEAAFDTKFSFSSLYRNTGTPYLRSQNTGSSSQAWENQVALEKRFAYGTEAKVYGAFNRSYNIGGEISPSSDFAAGIELTQPLLSGFGEIVNLAPLARARKNLEKTNLNLRKKTLDLILDTEIAYWNLSASYALVQARLSSLRYAEFVLEQVKKRRAINAATSEDVLQAEADVASRKVSLVSARQSVEDCDDALRKLLGQNGNESLGTYEVTPLSDNVPAEKLNFTQWISTVRDFDIDAQVQEIEREIAEIDYQVAEDADRPNLDLILGAELSGRESSPAKAFSGLYDRSGYNMSAGIRFSMPIGFRQAAAELRQAEKAKKSANLAIAEAIQNAMFNARSTWRACDAARERLEAAKIAMKMQRESYEGQVARLAVGVATVTDVLSAQDSLDAARLELIQAALDVAVSRSKMNRLDGRILSEKGFIWKDIDNL